MTARPAGRPRIGVQVTTTVPPAVLEAVDRIAAQCGQPRAAVLRDLITEGAARRMELETPGEDQVMQVTKTFGGCPGLQAGEESGFPRSGAGKADSPPGEPASPAAVPSAVSNR